MRPGTREDPALDKPGLPNAAVTETTDRQDTSRPSKSPTQRDKVLRWLIREGSVCSTTFLARYVPRAAAHDHALRQQGFVIVTQPCSRADHRHKTHQIEYVLEALPHDPTGGVS